MNPPATPRPATGVHPDANDDVRREMAKMKAMNDKLHAKVDQDRRERDRELNLNGVDKETTTVMIVARTAAVRTMVKVEIVALVVIVGMLTTNVVAMNHAGDGTPIKLGDPSF